MTRKSFSSPKVDKNKPITFDVNGVELKVKPTIPGMKMIGVMAVLDGERLVNDDGTGTAGTLRQFFSDVFYDEESRAAGFKVLYDEENIVPFATLIEIAQWLVSEIMENPTKSEESSSDTSKPTGDDSSENTSQEDAT